MSSTTIIYPGTFDPITLGHIDLIHRAGVLFNKVIVAVASNLRKKTLFSLDERIGLAKKVLGNHLQFEVVGFEGLLIDFAHQMQVKLILRGLRVVSDFEFELQLASMNRRLAPTIETIFMAPGEQYTYLSATMVREIAELGGDVSDFVHPEVKNALYQRFGRV